MAADAAAQGERCDVDSSLGERLIDVGAQLIAFAGFVGVVAVVAVDLVQRVHHLLDRQKISESEGSLSEATSIPEVSSTHRCQ